MKKLYVIILISLCACLLSACNSRQTISGQIISASSTSDSDTIHLVVRAVKGKDKGIIMDEETIVIPLIEGVNLENFIDKNSSDVMISADCNRFGSLITNEDGKKIKAYKARYIHIMGVLSKNALKLADGSYIDIWKSDSSVYQLSDGTPLLRVQNPVGPNNVYVAGAESLDVLSKTAQEKIMSYYANKNAYYDVNAELERAYADYKNFENKADFSPYLLFQETAPISSNEKVMYFLTSVTLPISGSNMHEVRLGEAFDRQTGEHISNWELFSCSEEEARNTILDIAGITDPVLRKEMDAALKPEHIVLFQSNLEVSYPRGTLPSQENTYILTLDYNESLRQILNDWAIPKQPKQDPDQTFSYN